MDFLPPEIEDYASQHSSPESDLLKKLNRETWSKVLYPRMLSGHLQGRILGFMSKLIKPRRVLEIGTYTGYSAICLSEGLEEGGLVETIDINEELFPMVENYLKEANLSDKIKCYTGDAGMIIPTLAGPFDLVFIDADKENYSLYFDLVFDKVNPGGLIIADNVLWSGKVLDEPKANDKETISIKAFNEKIRNDDRIEKLLLPVRDGLMFVRKIK